MEGEKADRLFGAARKKLLEAESVTEGAGAYNLACLSALLGEEPECGEWLEKSKTAGKRETLSLRLLSISTEVTIANPVTTRKSTLALAEVDFEALIADPAIGSVVRERLQIDPRARTGRAMWLLARNQPERAFKLLDGDPVEFFRDSVWPHVSVVLARRPPVELDAQQALELILTARREGDHVEARLRLGRFESKFAESAAVRDSEMLRADIGDWIARREEVERVRSEFAAHAAEGVSIDVRAVDDDLRVEIVYPLADVRFGPQVGWSRAGGEMRTGPGEVSLAQAEQRALHIATLFEPDSDVEVTAELRFPDTGEVPQLTMIRVNGVEIALAVLPDRTALAIARPVAPFRAEVFSHDLQPALTEAARAGGPTITPGAVHELRAMKSFSSSVPPLRRFAIVSSAMITGSSPSTLGSFRNMRSAHFNSQSKTKFRLIAMVLGSTSTLFVAKKTNWQWCSIT